MSTYEKIARIQKKLMGVEMPKSGYNNFKKFHYYELEDILPHIFQACFDEELTIFFSFTEDQAVLHIKSWEKEGDVGTRDEVSIRAPFPEITPNKGDNKIQTTGSYMTYLKRYLLMNTFLITEKDVVDAAGSKCNCNDKPAKKTAKSKATKAAAEPKRITNGLKRAANLCKKFNGVITEDGLIEKLSELRTKKLITKEDEAEAISQIKTNYDVIVEQLA